MIGWHSEKIILIRGCSLIGIIKNTISIMLMAHQVNIIHRRRIPLQNVTLVTLLLIHDLDYSASDMGYLYFLSKIHFKTYPHLRLDTLGKIFTRQHNFGQHPCSVSTSLNEWEIKSDVIDESRLRTIYPVLIVHLKYW